MAGLLADPVDDYVQGTRALDFRGQRLTLLAPHSVFSSHRIDDGTRLLLDALPAEGLGDFLDLGCGYGALGLPVALSFPASRGTLVDRDLLAVEFARRNAERNGLRNVTVLPSLGYRDIPAQAHSGFDWILCNLPARVGQTVLRYFLEEGLRYLRPEGQFRVVIIAPLQDQVMSAAAEVGLATNRVAATDRHVVFAIPSPQKGGGSEKAGRPLLEGPDVYARDRIELELPERLAFDRPTDLADEPPRLAEAIPLLLGELSSDLAPARALVVRCGYGLLPRVLLERYPEVAVVATDRDLLATAFTRRNAGDASAARLRVVDGIGVVAARDHAPYDLILSELLPPLGVAASARELVEAATLLTPGGRGLVVGPRRFVGEVLRSVRAVAPPEVTFRPGPRGSTTALIILTKKGQTE